VATSAVVLVLRFAVLLDSSLGLFTPEKPRPINLVGLSQMFGQDVKDAGKVNPVQQSTLCPITNKTLLKQLQHNRETLCFVFCVFCQTRTMVAIIF